MKELKFRAWNTLQRCMLNWVDCCDSNKLTLSNLLNRVISHLIPMQFTGLKDKNGKPIYEGDIIKWSTEKYRSCYEEKSENPKELIKIEWKSPVEWEDAGFVVTESFELDDKNNTWLIAVANECEVIGNIYETTN